jgi:hypothetical protein
MGQNATGYQGAAGVIEMIGGDFDQFIKVYNDIGAAVTNGDCYFLDFVRDADSMTVAARPTMEATATSAVYRQIVVVNNMPLGKTTIADKEWGYVQIRGYCPKVSTVTASDIDRFLQGTNASTLAADDGTTITTDSFGICLTNEDDVAGFVEAILFGVRTIIG